jgi:hypothetical protein
MTMHMKINKLLAILAFILITMALGVIAVTPPASGYEISIYSAYPPYFWFFIIGSIACGIVVVVREAFAQERSNWWWAGFSVILFANFIILLLPAFRGYAAYGRFDSLVQLGLIRDIELTGHLGVARTIAEDFYPMTHILALSISYVTGLDPKLVVILIPPIFFTLYAVSIYLLSRVVTQSHGQSLLVTAFGCLMLFSCSQAIFIPRTLTVFMLPLVFFLYYRSRAALGHRTAYATLFVVVLVAMPFFHPGDGGLFLLGMFLCFEISLRIYQWLNRRRSSETLTPLLTTGSSSINACLILFVTWFIWFSSFAIFSNNVRQVADWLVYHLGESQASLYVSWLERAGTSFYDAIEIFVMNHGQHILYFAVAGMITILAWRELLLSKSKVNPNIAIFSFIFLIFLIASLLSFVTGYSIGYVRLLNHAIFASTILNGLGLYWLYERWQNKRLFELATIFLLVTCMVLGMFNLFHSPIIKATNQQVSAMDIEGTKWLLAHQNDELLIDQISFMQYSYASALLGVQALPKNIRWGGYVEYQPPEHFGYDYYQTYGESRSEDRYFVNDKLSRVRYPEGIPQYPKAWLWTPADFERLEADPTVNRIYNSGEFEVFYVKAEQ